MCIRDSNGATLYLKQVNEKGGVNGKQLEAVTMDEQGDETQAVTLSLIHI